MLPLDNRTPIQLNVLNLYPTYTRFFNDYKPIQLLVQYNDIKTIRKSVSQQRISINDIDVIYSTAEFKAGIDFINFWIIYLNQFSNIAKPLIETKALAVILFEDYKHFYLSDFKVIFQQIMRSEYGSFYASVDAQRILTAFSKYNELRQVEQYTIRKQILKMGDDFINPQTAEVFKKIDASLAGKYSDQIKYREERMRLFYLELPRLQKLRDDFEDEQMKLIT